MKQLLLLIGVLLYLPTSTYATDRTFTVGNVSFTMLPVAGNTFYMGAQKTSNQQPNYDANASSNCFMYMLLYNFSVNIGFY